MVPHTLKGLQLIQLCCLRLKDVFAVLKHATPEAKWVNIIYRSECRSCLRVEGDQKRKAGHPRGFSQQRGGNTDLECGCQIWGGGTLRS